MEQREQFSSRLGFILISAGCAIGLGNVLRFPFIVGQYGGGAFVLIYMFFLVALGLPIMIMEFAVGRASKKSVANSFSVLQISGKWHLFGYFAAAGNYLLMMFYTTFAGWMLCYCVKTASGIFVGMNPEQVSDEFGAMVMNPAMMLFYMIVAVFIGFGICMLGLKNGVERVTKMLMGMLILIMVVLVFNSINLPGATEGLKFFLLPDFSRLSQYGLGEVIMAAMGQAFFTLSLGIGSMAIFGSYLGKEKRLSGEALGITILDTAVAMMAGLIIFPACFSFGVNPDAGMSLIFITLPNIFIQMAGGQLWGTLFFVFMSFAALTTLVAVFENIVAFGMDLFKWTRQKSVLVNIIIVIAISIPNTLGFNVLSFIKPMGEGTNIADLVDFIVSNNLLPLGALIYVLFCTTRYGWSFESFMKETNTGTGMKFPGIKAYCKYVLPILISSVFIYGYIDKFGG